MHPETNWHYNICISIHIGRIFCFLPPLHSSRLQYCAITSSAAFRKLWSCTSAMKTTYQLSEISRADAKVFGGKARALLCPAGMLRPNRNTGLITLRPKIKKLLPHFLNDFPVPIRHPFADKEVVVPPIDWQKARAVVADHSVREVNWLRPGERAAMAAAEHFLKEGCIPITRGETIIMNWTAGTRTAMPVLPGASAGCTTGPGRKGRSLVKCAT